MNNLQALKAVKILAPVSAANTAAATSGWIDIREAVGDISITLHTGAITGAIVWTVNHATAADGTGDAAFTPDDGVFGTVSANTVQRRTIKSSALGGWIKCVGTITTGPVLVAASCSYQPDEPA